MTNSSNSKTASARIIKISELQSVAISPIQTLELIESPELLKVPGAKRHFSGLLHWQEYWLPVIDLYSLLYGDVREPKYALIVVYRDQASGTLQRGALLVDNIVNTENVTNQQFTALPNDSGIWRRIADSCVTIQNKATPILNLSKLFSIHV